LADNEYVPTEITIQNAFITDHFGPDELDLSPQSLEGIDNPASTSGQLASKMSIPTANPRLSNGPMVIIS
jgi:hypothetical protein